MSKRSAENQLTKDNQDFSDSTSESGIQTAREKASKDVIASRKIVSVKRGSAAAQPKAAETKVTKESLSPKQSNTGGLFGGLTGLASKAAEQPGESSKKQSLFSGVTGLAAGAKSPKSPNSPGKKEVPVPGGLFSSLFADPAEGGNLFSSGAFSFSAPTGGLFGSTGETAFPSFGGGESKQGTPEEFGSENELQEPEQPAATGAQSDTLEGEQQIYQNDCKMFKLTKEDDEATTIKWVEKAIGFVRLLKNTETGNIRLVVRMKGVYRLVLNVGLVPNLCKAERQGNKSIKFNGIDEEGQLGTYRLNLITEDQQGVFWDHLGEKLKASTN